MLAAIAALSLALLPARWPAAVALQGVVARTAPLIMATNDQVTPDNPKGLSGPLITYNTISAEMRALVNDAFIQRNRERKMADKPPYESIDAMIDAYVELGAEYGWTREDAESEVVRFLQRKGLAEEGGFTGAVQDYVAQLMLVLLLGSLGYSTAIGGGLAAWDNPFF